MLNHFSSKFLVIVFNYQILWKTFLFSMLVTAIKLHYNMIDLVSNVLCKMPFIQHLSNDSELVSMATKNSYSSFN